MKKEMAEVEQQAKSSSRSGLIVWIILIIAVLVGGYFGYQYLLAPKTDDTAETEGQAVVLDPVKEFTYLSKVANTNGVYWVRECDLIWNDVEETQGNIDWGMMDMKVKNTLARDAYPLVMVKPFANWDQETCHPDSIYDVDYGEKGGKMKVGAPCDMEAYKSFLAQAVERYDGDGENDMPGLTQPLKYWEIMNEPVMQGESTGGMGEELKFFYGTSDEYLDILKNSYETIKLADPDSYVLNAGMAGMQKEVKDFWQPIMDQGGANYFDIANNHTISTREDREDLYMVKFNNWLKSYDAQDKPVWITEVQFGDLASPPTDLESFDKLMARATVFSLALGADKLFYIDNWLRWDDSGIDPAEKAEKEGGPIEEEEMPDFEIDQALLNSQTHKVYLNLVAKVNNFTSIKALKQKYTNNEEGHSGATSEVGQYKFTKEDESVVYVLWGDAQLPTEIKGDVIKTDIYGEEIKTTASKLKLSDSPIFVELVE